MRFIAFGFAFFIVGMYLTSVNKAISATTPNTMEKIALDTQSPDESSYGLFRYQSGMRVCYIFTNKTGSSLSCP